MVMSIEAIQNYVNLGGITIYVKNPLHKLIKDLRWPIGLKTTNKNKDS